jgi:hypothetical protein
LKEATLNGVGLEGEAKKEFNEFKQVKTNSSLMALMRTSLEATWCNIDHDGPEAEHSVGGKESRSIRMGLT